METNVSQIIEKLSELGHIDMNDPNFVNTPERVAKVLVEMSEGNFNLKEKIDKLFVRNFPKKYGGMVVKGPIHSWSLCPHHFLPYKLITYVGYIPGENVPGISKIPRLIKLLSKRFVLQEDLTTDIANILHEKIGAQGTGVVIDGFHTCSCSRGVKSEDWTMTISLKGIFEEISIKQEFFFHIQRRKESIN